jgi:hypothetical protein
MTHVKLTGRVPLFWMCTAIGWMMCLIAAPSSRARPSPEVAAPKVTIEPEPVYLKFDAADAKATGKLELLATDISWSLLEIRAQPFMLGKNEGSIRFSRTSLADSISLGDPLLGCIDTKPCSVDLEAVGLKARGTYTGTLDVYSASAKLASVTVNAVVPDPVFDPLISGESLKNDVLTLDAEQEGATFLSVTSPGGSPLRTYQMKTTLMPATVGTWISHLMDFFGGCQNTGQQQVATLSLEPATFSLEGGASQPVIIRAPECLKGGTYEGVLTISDANVESLSRSKALLVKKGASDAWRHFILLFWVVIGAGLSVALNNAFPLSRARRERFAEIEAIDAKINGVTLVGAELRGSLRSEGRRLWLLLETLTFLNPQKNAILTEAASASSALAKLVDAASLINGLRAENLGARKPIRTQLAIEAQLRIAEQALIRADIAGGQGSLTAARTLSDGDLVLATLASALTNDVEKLLKERPNGGDPIPSGGRDSTAREASRAKAVSRGRPAQIAHRVLQLEVDQSAFGSMNVDDLLAVERDFYIADVWTDVMEFALRADPSRFGPMAPRLLAQLEATPGASHTQLLIDLIKSNLAPADIEAALATNAAHIECNDFPRYLDLERFVFEYTDPALNNVPAARLLPSYRWQFDDRESRPDDGEQCMHFFLPPRGLARIAGALSLRGPVSREAQVTVSIPSLSDKTYTFKKRFPMRAQRDHASALTATQVMSFLITTATAVLAAYGTQYGGVTPADLGWSACISALVFGFGIDQVRDRATNG